MIICLYLFLLLFSLGKKATTKHLFTLVVMVSISFPCNYIIICTHVNYTFAGDFFNFLEDIRTERVF